MRKREAKVGMYVRISERFLKNRKNYGSKYDRMMVGDIGKVLNFSIVGSEFDGVFVVLPGDTELYFLLFTDVERVR